MIPIIEDAILGTDLDGQFYNLLNVKNLDPLPVNLAAADDVRLTDERQPMAGSVTNTSVAADAAIDQSKLALNGQIPTAWLGTSSDTAAQGDLAEYLANKDQPNGYAGLDAFGKIPSAALPDAVGLATVTSVELVMPPEFFILGFNPITTSGTFDVHWDDLSEAKWFGCLSGGGTPTFHGTPLPAELIPNMDASRITSGTIAAARLPVAVGVGFGHAKGAVPDTGASGSVTDYLGRDIHWHTAPTLAISYQPILSTPTIEHTDEVAATQTITPTSSDTGVTFFFSTTNATTGFEEFPEVGYVALDFGDSIWIYSARTGWNNSAIATYANT